MSTVTRTLRFGEDIRDSSRRTSARALFAVCLAAATAACNNAVTPTSTTTTSTTTTTTSQTAPTVTGISPTMGTDEGGTTVTIAGTGFTNVSTVVFGGATAVSYVVNSDRSITATAPPETAGVVDVVVTTTGGSSAVNNADSFEFAPNALASLSFASTAVAAGLPMRGDVSISFPAPAAGIRIPLTWSTSPSGSGAALYPLAVSIPAAATSVSFQVTTFFVSSPVTVQVSADRGGQTRTASFVIQP